MAIILGANTLSAAFSVANSCRFNHDDSAYMHKTPGTATNRKIFTISLWTKRSELYGVNSETKYMASAGDNAGSNIDELYWRQDTLDFSGYESSTQEFQLRSTPLYRDMSAWYHIVIAYDSTQGTASNRIKAYINGVQITSWAVATYPDADHEPLFNSAIAHEIGRNTDARYYDGYMAEVVFIDGSALTPTSFGEFSEDSPTIWMPKDVSGLTFGTNGFYLDFEDSSNLGNDANGGTDFTEVNLAAIDQATDTPTNNFATLNPLDTLFGTYTFSEGNLAFSSNDASRSYTISTIGVSTGKWYFESLMTTNAARACVGIAGAGSLDNNDPESADASPSGCVYRTIDGQVKGNDGTYSTFYNTATTSDDIIIGCALDLTSGTNTIAFSIDGAWVDGDSSTDTDFSNATLVNNFVQIGATENGVYHFIVGDDGGGQTVAQSVNFGSPAFAISSGNADGNGYGNFEFPVPSSYYSLCTKNLAEFG